jgi:hypothetical protein
MGSNFYPVVSSPIKSIQRGTAASAGAITIASVNTSNTFVKSYSTGSAGTVAATGNTSGGLSPSGGVVGAGGGGNAASSGSWPNYVGTRSISAGSTSLTASEYGVYLTNSTTLTATGACKWEVIEYN